MKKFSLSLVLFSLLSIVAIGQSDSKSLDIIKILKKNRSKAYVNDYCSNFEFICLETSNECLIDIPVQLEIDKEQIYVRDRTRSIFIFNRQGEYISKILAKGKGPGEFVEIHQGFILFKDMDRICVYDEIQRKILLFDTRGNFLKEAKVNIRAQAINRLGSNILLMFSDAIFDEPDYHKIIYFDINEMKVVKTIKIQASTQIIGAPMYSNPGFSTDNDEALLKIPFCDTIFRINAEADIPDQTLPPIPMIFCQ